MNPLQKLMERLFSRQPPGEEPKPAEAPQPAEEEKRSWAAWLWKAIFKGLEGGITISVSSLVKWLLALIFVGGSAWLVREFYLNPWETIHLEGYVLEYNQPDVPLPDATVFLRGFQGIELAADANGRYAGQIRVRRQTDGLVLACHRPGYHYQEKWVYIPADRSRRIITDFQLSPR